MPQLYITTISPGGPRGSWRMYGNGSLGGGVGGWETLDRARQLQATEWVAQPAHTQSITVVALGVDAYGPGQHRSVDGDVAMLRGYGKPGAPGAAPPLLSLTGPIEQPAPWTLWVVQGIDPVEEPETIRDSAGHLIQAAYTLSLLEWTGAAILLGPAAAARARAGKG